MNPLKEAVAELEEGLATLLEMFPHCCRVEAAHCLTLVTLSSVKVFKIYQNGIECTTMFNNVQNRLEAICKKLPN